jgi:hypothetical protein
MFLNQIDLVQTKSANNMLKEDIIARIVQEQKDQPRAKNKTRYKRSSTAQRRERKSARVKRQAKI